MTVNDVLQLLRRQAAWQKTRQDLSWPEKLRMAQRVRESVAALRATHKPPGATSKSRAASHSDNGQGAGMLTVNSLTP